MKKNLLILAALFCSAILIMYVLVKGAEPDRIHANFTRDYHKYKLLPIDTVLFPGRVSIMKTDQGNIYGYVYNQNSIFRYNPSTHKIDTFLAKKNLPINIVTRLETDTTSHTFYIFDDTGNKAITYQPGKNKIDSILFQKNTKVFSGSSLQNTSFLSSGYDTTKKILALKLRNFSSPGKDSVLHQFPFFEDGGLSADGFFIRNTSSHDHFYIPFYNGQIIKYDDQLNKTSVFHTIDKTKANNITVKTGKIYMRSSKSIVINSTATADAGHLYILSYVLTEEAATSGYRGPVIDVYNTKTGNYEGSFRLPGFENRPVIQLARYADKLVAAYENNILIFKLTSL
jgi:outer membrane protein assembly factor BamB